MSNCECGHSEAAHHGGDTGYCIVVTAETSCGCTAYRPKDGEQLDACPICCPLCGDQIYEDEDSRSCMNSNCSWGERRPDIPVTKQADGTLPDGDEGVRMALDNLLDIARRSADGRNPLAKTSHRVLSAYIASLSSQLQAERERREAAENVIDTGLSELGDDDFFHTPASKLAFAYRERYPQEEK